MSGAFHVDDQAQLFELVLDAPGSLTVTSIGYAGGLDVDGQAVAAGGFDTMLFLYSSDGTLLAQSDDGVDTPIDPVTGINGDASFTTMTLAAGLYQLVLTQFDNFALGDLAAGFSRSGEGNFTPSLSGTCAADAFCDWTGDARTSAWTLNIIGAARVAMIPEPATAWLVLGAAAVLGAVRRGRRTSPGTSAPAAA